MTMSGFDPGDGTQPGAEDRAPDDAALDALVPALEALLFAAGDPLTLEELRSALPAEDRAGVGPALERLEAAYRRDGRGLQILRVAGGYRITTRPEYDRHLRALYRQRHRQRLGPAALETLAVVAYRQPVTGPEIAEIRGVDPQGVLQTLLERKLIRTVGRKRVVGRPFLYGTTKEFLVHFGLDSLDDLPRMEEFSALVGEPPPPPAPDRPPDPAAAGEE
jgi:segregation and condensation protein B